MTSDTTKGKALAALFMAVIGLGFGPARAEAQWGMGLGGGGFGGGFGWGLGFTSVPKPESFLYSKALVDAGRDTHIPSRDVYSHNPNSYINHIRDNGFVERYDVARRDPSYYRYAPQTAQSSSPSPSPRTVQTAMAVPPPTPLLPLSSFYNAEGHIVWPADAPTNGELKEKRTIFDQASQVVLAESKKSGVASIATVTDARQKLLEYGRPSLQYVRTHETPRVADTFHLFLLSLYESLAQAINPAATPAVPPSAG
jgi:hypothetical protein